ncbi:MAG TPA: right-handed parallel beta-helix repeat-containing protein [Methanobacterium sp.]|nr:right-handed parallel beta-helix repeat-containing protein [Methanobacterium sp.]
MKKIRKQAILIILTITFILILCGAVSAADTVSGDPYVLNNVYVSPTGNDSNSGADVDHPVQTIQTGLYLANNTGTVHLAEGTYNKSISSSSKDYGIQIDRNVTIIGSGKDRTIIDALGDNNMFYVPPDFVLTIKDLTMRNGNQEGGGAIFNIGTCTVTNCAFENNEAGGGGAIGNLGTCTVTDSIFTDNEAYYSGGAIWNIGTLVVSGCTFNNNSARMGGAIYDNKAILNITNSIIENNKAVGNTAELNAQYEANGGGIYLYDSSSYEIIGNQILNNTGSGIYIGREDLRETTIIDSTSDDEKSLINFNRIYGNTPYGIYYEDLVVPSGEVSAAKPIANVNATLNWWGSNGGPNSTGADKTNLVSAYYAPWIVMGFTPQVVTINGGQTTQLIATFLYDNLGNYHDPANGHIPDGTPVLFTTSLGQVGSQFITKYTSNGIAIAILRAWNAAGEPVWGTAYITATTDAQLLSNSVTMLEVPTVSAKSTEKTIGMLPTGLPLAGLILAILALFGGLSIPKRK